MPQPAGSPGAGSSAPNPTFADRVRQAFQPTPWGVVGLVDNLLALGRHDALRLDFHDGQCHVRSAGGPAQEVVVPLPRSVVRALLARIATLCTDSRPGSVTPYGGAGEFSFPTTPPAAFHLAFTNTPSEQHLELTPLAGPTNHNPAVSTAGSNMPPEFNP